MGQSMRMNLRSRILANGHSRAEQLEKSRTFVAQSKAMWSVWNWEFGIADGRNALLRSRGWGGSGFSGRSLQRQAPQGAIGRRIRASEIRLPAGGIFVG